MTEKRKQELWAYRDELLTHFKGNQMGEYATFLKDQEKALGEVGFLRYLARLKSVRDSRAHKEKLRKAVAVLMLARAMPSGFYKAKDIEAARFFVERTLVKKLDLADCREASVYGFKPRKVVAAPLPGAPWSFRNMDQLLSGGNEV